MGAFANPAGGAAPQGQTPTQAPASPIQMALAKISQMLQGLAQQNPAAQPGLTKAVQGISEAQAAIVGQSAPQPAAGNPPV